MRKIDAWGRVIIDPDETFQLAYAGFDVWSIPAPPSTKVDQFNELCNKFDKSSYCIETLQDIGCTPEEELTNRSETWFIDDDVRNINVREFLLELCSSDEQRQRVNLEMDLFEERNLIPLLQLMIYLVDHFRINNVIWGVGRGSSVSSYVLFLIGIHRIDSLKYDLSIHDFLN